jgi:hypothetical protein
MIDRHGGNKMMSRAFDGFLALPAPVSCWDVLGVAKGAPAAAIKAAFKRKAVEDTSVHGNELADLIRARDQALACAP